MVMRSLPNVFNEFHLRFVEEFETKGEKKQFPIKRLVDIVEKVVKVEVDNNPITEQQLKDKMYLWHVHHSVCLSANEETFFKNVFFLYEVARRGEADPENQWRNMKNRMLRKVDTHMTAFFHSLGVKVEPKLRAGRKRKATSQSGTTSRKPSKGKEGIDEELEEVEEKEEEEGYIKDDGDDGDEDGGEYSYDNVDQ